MCFPCKSTRTLIGVYVYLARNRIPLSAFVWEAYALLHLTACTACDSGRCKSEKVRELHPEASALNLTPVRAHFFVILVSRVAFHNFNCLSLQSEMTGRQCDCAPSSGLWGGLRCKHASKWKQPREGLSLTRGSRSGGQRSAKRVLVATGVTGLQGVK